jgi:RHS repeat-associated protein
MTSHTRKILLLALLLFGFTSAASAQDPDDIQQGLKAYGTYRGGDFDSVSMNNGNLVVDIPLVSYPQRGKLHLNYFLTFQRQAVLSNKTVCLIDTCTNYVNVTPGQLAITNNLHYTTKITTVPLPGNDQQFSYYSLVSPDGSTHTMGQLAGSTTNYETVDATGYFVYNTSSFFTYDADGTKYTNAAAAALVEDANGNQITAVAGGVTDTVGRSIPNVGSKTNGTGSCPTGPLTVVSYQTWTVPGPSTSGGSSTFLFCYAQINVIISYDITNGTTVTENLSTLQSVVLPNGTLWIFQYDAGTGNISEITLPTGGTISYNWGDTGGCSASVAPAWVVSRTVNANDGSGSHTWNYTYNGNNTTTAEDPLGNYTVYTNQDLNWCSNYTTSIQYYQGAVNSGNLLKTVSTTYNQTPSPFGEEVGRPYYMNIVPTQITTTWAANNKTTQINKSYDSGYTFVDPRGNGVQYTGLYGKVTIEKDYDYGSGGPGSLLKQVNTSYAWQSPNPNYSSYLANNMLNLVYSSQITDGTNQKAYTQYGHDENPLQASGMGAAQNLDLSVWTGAYRGNQTSVNRWLNLPTVQTVTNEAWYYDTGMPNYTKDPLLNQTTYFYSGTFQDAYVTEVTNALNQSAYYNYDWNTGLKISTTDPNQLVTTYSYDSMWRLLQAIHPDNGQDTITRQETSFPFTATLTSTINTTQNAIPLSVFDGLGRVSETQLTSDPQGIAYTDTTYDALGRVATVSNPYRTGTDATSSPKGTVTTYGYDALGRKISETYPDSSVLTTAYCGPSTLVTDPTNKWRRSRTDGLGRLVEVDEPNAVGATVASSGCPGTGEPIWVTSYTYDVLGNLTQAVQNGSHTRTFTYDSLSRLLTSSNPETGQIIYTYDANGNVLTKMDARNITTNYSPSGHPIDALNRVTGITYSNGDPSLTFTYDGTSCLNLQGCQNIGHRTSMTDGAGSEAWAYYVDKTNSRSIHQEQRITNSSPNNITKSTTYYLDLAGNVTQIVYPTGRTVNYAHDSANRPSSAADASNGITYVADWETPPANTNCTVGAVCYTPQGSVYGMSIGQSSSFTGFNVLETFNSRLQPNEIKASSSAGNAIDITYNFVDPATMHNAGHLYGITNNLNSSRSQAFTYDQVNRILSAGTTATNGTYCWGYQYSYDAWGNLLSQAGWTPTYNGCTETTMAAVTANGDNQISGFSYDASGNTLNDGNYTYTWDGESQMKTAAGVTYAYDGEGRRAAKVGSKLYWYGSGGEILAETDAAGNTLNEYIFFGGKRVAVVPAAGSVLYYAEDLLGSSRVLVQSNGTLCYDGDFTPFGGEKAYTSTCPQNYKFEGKERDTETQNDDFGARYYTWRFGRWLSSDWSAVPVAVPYANLANPQTLNLYSMVADDPESFADLDGHDGNGSTVGPGASWAGVSNAGGGRLTEGQVAGMGDDAPTVVDRIEPDSVLQARADQFMEWARATGNAGFGAQNTLGVGPDELAKHAEKGGSESGVTPTVQPGPAPTDPATGKPLPPPIPAPVDVNGKPTNWKPIPGSGPIPGNRWVPDGKVPSPDGKGGTPAVVWDPHDGYWTHDDGGGNRTHWGTNGAQVIKQVGFWATVGLIVRSLAIDFGPEF